MGRFNGILNKTLAYYVYEKPISWPKYLHAIICNTQPQKSPNELTFSFQPTDFNGIISMEKNKDYNLKKQISEHKKMKENVPGILKQYQSNQKHYYDKKGQI